MGDKASLKYFNDNLLGPIQKDLLEFTWLTERYTCEGLRERTPFFFEYPCLLSMMLKEMKYGMNFGLTKWNLDPTAGTSPFHWQIGSTDVKHNRTGATLRHPGSGPRRVTINGLTPSMAFVATSATSGCGSETQRGMTTANGVTRWNASNVRCGIIVTLE